MTFFYVFRGKQHKNIIVVGILGSDMNAGSSSVNTSMVFT